jgi:hypothetical protein
MIRCEAMLNEQIEEEGLPSNFLEILAKQNFYIRLGLRCLGSEANWV